MGSAFVNSQIGFPLKTSVANITKISLSHQVIESMTAKVPRKLKAPAADVTYERGFIFGWLVFPLYVHFDYSDGLLFFW